MELCIEWCQHCNTEIEVEAEKFIAVPCPNCGVKILPCDLCNGNCLANCPGGMGRDD